MKQVEKDWAQKLREIEKRVKLKDVAPDLFGRKKATPEEVKRIITRPKENDKKT